jgi:hypothetical protein
MKSVIILLLIFTTIFSKTRVFKKVKPKPIENNNSKEKSGETNISNQTKQQQIVKINKNEKPVETNISNQTKQPQIVKINKNEKSIETNIPNIPHIPNETKKLLKIVKILRFNNKMESLDINKHEIVKNMKTDKKVESHEINKTPKTIKFIKVKNNVNSQDDKNKGIVNKNENLNQSIINIVLPEDKERKTLTEYAEKLSKEQNKVVILTEYEDEFGEILFDISYEE